MPAAHCPLCAIMPCPESPCTTLCGARIALARPLCNPAFAPTDAPQLPGRQARSLPWHHAAGCCPGIMLPAAVKGACRPMAGRAMVAAGTPPTPSTSTPTPRSTTGCSRCVQCVMAALLLAVVLAWPPAPAGRRPRAPPPPPPTPLPFPRLCFFQRRARIDCVLTLPHHPPPSLSEKPGAPKASPGAVCARRHAHAPPVLRPRPPSPTHAHSRTKRRFSFLSPSVPTATSLWPSGSAFSYVSLNFSASPLKLVW